MTEEEAIRFFEHRRRHARREELDALDWVDRWRAQAATSVTRNVTASVTAVTINPRGRPRTSKAMTGAERVRLHRARKRASS
jgi:hypothetical protein